MKLHCSGPTSKQISRISMGWTMIPDGYREQCLDFFGVVGNKLFDTVRLGNLDLRASATKWASLVQIDTAMSSN